jgi:hypothetical protein
VSLGSAASSEMVDDVLQAYAAAASELNARFEEVCLPSSTLQSPIFCPHRQRGSRTSGRAKPKDGEAVKPLPPMKKSSVNRLYGVLRAIINYARDGLHCDAPSWKIERFGADLNRIHWATSRAQGITRVLTSLR